MGKDLMGVRSPQRQLAPDTVGSEQRKPTFLRGIANKARADKRHRFRDSGPLPVFERRISVVVLA
jgi:hypothetical protein